MTVELLEAAAAALGDLREQVVFLGGATVGLWFTDPAVREPRVTYDVDVVAEVTTPGAYARFQEELRRRGFAEDIESGITVRYRHGDSGLIHDCLSSRGFEDVVLLVDGREELAVELDALPDDARTYVRGEFGRVLGLPSFEYGVEGALAAQDSRERARAVTIPRFQGFAAA